MSHPGHDHREGAVERYSTRSHPEHVVLEIGDEMGALIVHTRPELHGVEVEISPAGRDGTRSHKEVLERRIEGRPAYTAVFDRLTEGRYTLWVDDEARARDVEVVGAQVAEVDWTASRANQRPATP